MGCCTGNIVGGHIEFKEGDSGVFTSFSIVDAATGELVVLPGDLGATLQTEPATPLTTVLTGAYSAEVAIPAGDSPAIGWYDLQVEGTGISVLAKAVVK